MRWVVNFTHRPSYPRVKYSGTHKTEGYMDCRSGLKVMEKTKPLILVGSRTPNRLAHRLVAIPISHPNQQTRCKISQVYYLTFMYSSTCFGRPHARPRPTTLLPPHSNGKTRGCYCSYWAPDDWREDAPETCWAVHKRQVINLRNCCI